ncbi:hypothetical protein [Nocardioides sp.]|uniref:hypothetical protein n=1 Tax=Nocardioides sp. TaxID=35761 RepID=UPI0035165026
MTPEIDYAAWGEAFFTTAVTTERVLAGLGVLADRPLEVGPLKVGPAGLASVRARGTIGDPVGTRTSATRAEFAVTLPVHLEFTIGLGVDKHRFEADLAVPLRLSARARADLSILLDVVPPTPEEITVDLRARSRRATLTQYAANVDSELRRVVSRFVQRELDKPYVQAATVIDVDGAVAHAITTLVARSRTVAEG